MIVAAAIMVAATSCSGGSSHAPAASMTDSTGVMLSAAAAPGELPLPEVPTMITEPRDRAAYVMVHFWDSMDWSDSTLTASEPFMEQNFANFASLIPHAGPEGARKGMDSLIESAAGEPGMVGALAEIARKYLYDPNSPMLNAQGYEQWVDALLASGHADEATALRARAEKEELAKSPLGKGAPQLAIVDRNGRRTTIDAIGGRGMTVLLFYDPDCAECASAIAEIDSNPAIAEMRREGALTLVAIDAYSDSPDASSGKIPAGWIDAYPAPGNDPHALFSIRATPSIYLLDSDLPRTIRLRDVGAPALLRALE